jgi:hypothetical protein
MSDLQNRLSVALNREVNLNHEKVSDLVFELVEKVEGYEKAFNKLDWQKAALYGNSYFKGMKKEINENGK